LVGSDLWSLPGRYKYNVVTLFSSYLNRIGIDICVWDSQVTFILTKVVLVTFVFIRLMLAKLWIYIMHFSGWVTCNLIMSILNLIQRPLLMLFMLLGTSFLNLVVSRLLINPYSVFLFTNSRMKLAWRQANEVAHVLAVEAP